MTRCRVLLVSLVALVAACDGVPPCTGRLVDACRKAQDLAYGVGVQLGDEAASGNAVLGDAAAIGSTGKAMIAVRGTGMRRDGPVLSNVTVRTDSSVGSSAFGARSELASAFSIDAAVGGIHGMRIRDTEIGTIDVLGSVTAMPNADRGNLHVGGSPITFGIGVRLGIVAETKTLPAVSFAASLRTPRKFSVTAPALPTDSGDAVKLSLSSGEVSTLGLRLASSKRIGRIGITGGVGQDTYYITTDYGVTGSTTLGEAGDLADFNVTRTNAFVGASYAAGRVTIAAEMGRLFGGHVPPMMNTFGDGSATAGRNWLTIGMRMPAGRTNDRH